MDAAVGITTGPTARSWKDELRATLTLAWPLMLANLTMQLIQATDVVLLGWLGPNELAAAALALGLSFGMILFALGVLTASSPMMASALGARFNAVRDARRTFRQSLWAAAIMAVPVLIVLWNAERVILAFGQDPELARLASLFLRGYMWVIPPWLLFQVLRNFVAWLDPRDQRGRNPAERLAQLGADLRPFWPAEAWHHWCRDRELDRVVGHGPGLDHRRADRPPVPALPRLRPLLET